MASQHDIEWERLFGGFTMYRGQGYAGPDFVLDLNRAFADIEFNRLVRWWTGCLNELLTEVTDLGRYRDSEGVFDARAAYREARTLDRLFVTALRIQLYPSDHVLRVGAAFELFDLLPELIDGHPGARQTWNALLDPDRARRIFDEAFADVPAVIAEPFREKAQAVIAHLEEEALATAVPGRRADDGIIVGSAGPVMPEPEYLGRLFQALRDTHHGYELSALWKRNVLDSHTGHIPFGFSELALLYVFAFVAEPRAALQGEWFDE